MNFKKIAVSVFIFVYSFFSWGATPIISGSIIADGETTHFELTGQNNWVYDLKKNSDYIELIVDPFDQNTLNQVLAFKSDVIKQVKVDTKAIDNKYSVKFYSSKEGVDFFDYQTDQPSRMIIDFYINPEKKTISALPVKKSVTATNAKAQKQKLRVPAGTDVVVIANQGPLVAQNKVGQGIYDGNDPHFERFSIKNYEIKEEAILRSKQNYYISLPILENPLAAWEQVKNAPVEYSIVPENSKENKMARFLLTLFEKKRFNTFFKVQEWFTEKYPQSKYMDVLNYMSADMYLNSWYETQNTAHFDKAILLYKEAIKKYPQSQLTEKTSLKIGFLNLERKDYLSSIRAFQEHIESKLFKSNSYSKDLAKLGTALSFKELNKYSDALQVYDQVESESEHKDLVKEASSRKGDVYFKEKKYAEAIRAYDETLLKFPTEAESLPNVVFNKAEAMFLLDKKNDSYNEFYGFIKRFPKNNYSAFAMTRIGELLEIFGADPTKVIGAYLETYFRYGESPNAIIARLRMISKKMKNMKERESIHAIKEIMSLAKKLDIGNIEQFATVMIAEGHNSRGEYLKAIDLLEKYYKENPFWVDRDQFKKRIITNINDKIKNEFNKGKYIEALNTHSQYAGNWLKNSPRLDTQYYIGKSFEQLGSPAAAEKTYKEVINRTYAIRGTQLAKELQAINAVPKEDELNLRLAAISAKQNKLNNAYEYLKNIKNPENLSEEDQIERVDLAVSIFENRGEIEVAVRYLTELLKTWHGQPGLVAGSYLKLAQFELQQKKTQDAIQSLVKIDQMMMDSKKVNPSIHKKSLQMLGDIYFESGNKNKTIEAYSRLLALYENTDSLSPIRYKLGDIYFKNGDMQKATEAWAVFKGPNGETWKKLAQEQLKNADWQDNYKKYIKRIPAMTNDESTKETK